MADDSGGGRVRVRGDRLTWRDVGGEIVALDLHSSTYFSANGSASVLLRVLAHGATSRELVLALLAEYDVPQEQAAQDVEAFLCSLEAHHLLERVDP